MLLEQAERLAIADRQALLTAAAVNGAADYTPIDVGERIEEWRAWLAGEPGRQVKAGPSMAERVGAFEAQVAAFPPGIGEVA